MAGRDPDYPLPSHAVSAWTDGNDLFLGTPPLDGQSRGQVLRISLERCSVENSGFGKPLARQTGWLVFKNLLFDRMHAASAKEDARLGTRSAPIQYEIDGIMRALTKFDVKGREVISADDLNEVGNPL